MTATHNRQPGRDHVEHFGVRRQFGKDDHRAEKMDEAKVEPTRISFVYALSLVCREWQRANAPRAAIGNIPRDLATLRLNLKRGTILR